MQRYIFPVTRQSLPSDYSLFFYYVKRIRHTIIIYHTGKVGAESCGVPDKAMHGFKCFHTAI